MKKFLASITVEEQFHVSIIAIAGMMLMLVATTIYLVGWVTESWVFRTLIVINALFGFMFLGSMLATTYQQLQTYKTVQESSEFLGDIPNVFGELKGGNTNGKEIA